MVTLVGTQKNLNDAIRALIELEYDAIEAYQLAIDKIQSPEFKQMLLSFQNDHEHHIAAIKTYFMGQGLNLPDSPDLKGMLTKLKVAIGSAMGDDLTILKAMLDNELDTNKAYENMLKHESISTVDSLRDILINAHADEKTHKQWLEQVIAL